MHRLSGCGAHSLLASRLNRKQVCLKVCVYEAGAFSSVLIKPLIFLEVIELPAPDLYLIFIAAFKGGLVHRLHRSRFERSGFGFVNDADNYFGISL